MKSVLNRREFFKLSALSLGALALLRAPFAWAADAFKTPPPAGKRIADPAAGAAKTQSYVHHAKDYKGPKRPAIVAGAHCANCTQYKKTTEPNWAPCAILAQAWVYEDGLCALYMKNPKAV